MVVESHRPWTEKKFDDFLRKWYNPKIHVDPACLELGLRKIGWVYPRGGRYGSYGIRTIVNRLSKLGLRKRNKHE